MSDIITTEFIKTYFPDRSESDLILIQSRVTSLIAEYLRTSFQVTTYKDTYNTLYNVVTQHLPITEVTQIEDLTLDQDDSGRVLTPGTDYIVYPECINFPSRTAGTKDISISYSAGLTEFPVMVSIVAEDLVRYWAFKEGKVDELFFKSEDMEDRSYINRDNSEKKILSKLAEYRYSPLGSANRSRLVRIGVI